MLSEVKFSKDFGLGGNSEGRKFLLKRFENNLFLKQNISAQERVMYATVVEIYLNLKIDTYSKKFSTV